MKKIIAILLVFVLVLPMCIIPASAETEKEITFRGIPFGTSYTETIAALKEQGIEFDKDPYFNKEETGYCIASSNAPIEVEVAGHTMELEVNFVHPDLANNMDPKVEDCVFYRGRYSYRRKADDSKDYNELVIKLTSLYGDPVYDNTWKPDDLKARWENDDVQIDLKAQYLIYQNPIYGHGDQTIRIDYTWKKGETMYSQNSAWYREKMERERENQILSTGTGGL